LEQKLDEERNTAKVNPPPKHEVPLQANKLTYRLSDLTVPLENRRQDRHFPAIEKLSYDNYLVAVI
jgi:hypothetical protein